MKKSTIEKYVNVLMDMKEKLDGKGFTKLPHEKFAKSHKVNTNFVWLAEKAGIIHPHTTIKGTYQWSYPGVLPTVNDAKKIAGMQCELLNKGKKSNPITSRVISRKPIEPTKSEQAPQAPIIITPIISAAEHVQALRQLGYTGTLTRTYTETVNL